MKVLVNYEGPIPAPLRAGDVVATLKIVAPEMETIEYPLRAVSSVQQLGLIRRFGAAIKSVLWGFSG